MILVRSREFTINMGDYESLKIGASVTLDTEKLPEELAAEATQSDLWQTASEMLDEALADDIKQARELTYKKDSYVLSWKV